MPGKINGREAPNCTKNGNITVPYRMMHANNIYDSKPLRIMQYNVAKRREVMDSILNDQETQEYTLLLLLEPCCTYNQKKPLLHQSWTAIEPTHLMERPPHAAIYANNKKMPPATFEQIHIPHSDIIAIAIAAHPPFHKPTLIVNLYNSDNHSLIEQLCTILLHHIKIVNYEVIPVAGDFNLHYALRNPAGYINQEPQVETLVEVMMEANLRTLLPLGMVTFLTLNETGATAIDLVWGNEKVEDILLKCHTVEQTNDHGSDHHPIEIILDLSPKKLPPTAYPYNCNKTNWELVKIELKCRLPSLIDPSNITPNDLDNYALSLATTNQKAITK
jgi:hypothetical protein